MLVGERLRTLREERKLSQREIQKRTGLVRPYVSRVEKEHTVPSIETLEKLARALVVPLYHLFYEGEEPLAPPDLPEQETGSEAQWGSSDKGARILSKLRRLLSGMDQDDRRLLLQIAEKLATRSGAK